LLRKIPFKFLLASIKTLLILEILHEAASECPTLATPLSKRIGNLNSAFEKAGSQSPACDFENLYRNPLQNLWKFSPSSPAYGTIYRITGGFLNAATCILKRQAKT
jgi:hypothetical protein